MATFPQTVRQGLPRRPGGPAWPDVGAVVIAAPHAERPSDEPSDPPHARPAGAPVAPPPVATTIGRVLRRGLPRVAGGAPWPTTATAVVQRAAAPASEPVVTAPTAAVTAPPPPSATAPEGSTPRRAPRTIGRRTIGAWVRRVVLRGLGVLVAAGVVVLAARGVTTLPGVPELLERYPGAYEPPAFAPVGFPVWLNWMHYLNFFFMVLVVRSGLQVRRQQNPPAYWAPRRGGKKISISLWLHTSLDLLWLLNGVVFVVLLFATGQWARIVPTSWEVFPNALSAGLQYLTLDWPAEHGWVYYNSLQQLMYFLVVFVAAPLAAITGARMSEWWPRDAERLNRFYPASLARAVHYPTMLFFVLFVVVHVFLVFTTGALRNLNHMFAASDTVSWAGFGWFAAGLAVAIGAVLAARPLVTAPIASLFGKVSSR